MGGARSGLGVGRSIGGWMTDNWILTRGGVRFSLTRPAPEMVRLDDIAFALAHVNRFAGHAGGYSVAEHSVRASWLGKTKRERAYLLLHDAHEAYIGDISSPLKNEIGRAAIQAIARRIDGAVHRRFGLRWPRSAGVEALVRRADLVMLATERRHLMPAGEWDIELPAPLKEAIRPWKVGFARAVFTAAADDYGLPL